MQIKAQGSNHWWVITKFDIILKKKMFFLITTTHVYGPIAVGRC